MGAALRSARAARNLSLDELHARTKISIAHLIALEEGRFDALPPLAFSRGFLRTVAHELGVDPEPLIRELTEIMHAERPQPAEDWVHLGAPIVEATEVPPYRRRVILVGLVVIIVLIAAAAWLTRQILEFAQSVPAEGPPTTTAMPRTSVPAPAPSPTPVGSLRQKPALPGTTRARTEAIVEVYASGRSWLLVRSGEDRLFEGFIRTGQVMRWVSGAPITLRAGNAGVLSVIVNGNALGVYGRLGEVVERTFEPGVPP